MTEKEQQKILKRIDALEDQIQTEVGSSTMDLINELVELNIEIEKECNHNFMLKKDLKKSRIWIHSGYAGGKPVINVDIEVPYDGLDRPGATITKTVARIDTAHIEKFIGCRVRGGAFKFVEGGRKYKRIELI